MSRRNNNTRINIMSADAYDVAKAVTIKALKVKRDFGSKIAADLLTDNCHSIDGLSKEDLYGVAYEAFISGHADALMQAYQDADADAETVNKSYNRALVWSAFKAVTARISKVQRDHAPHKMAVTAGVYVGSAEYETDIARNLTLIQFWRAVKDAVPAIEWQIVLCFHRNTDSPTRPVSAYGKTTPPKYAAIKSFIGAPDMTDNQLRALLQRTRRHIKAVAREYGIRVTNK